MRFCCIDPGITNFAISIEEFDSDELMKLSFKGQRYHRDRIATPEFELFLYEKVYNNGRLIYYNLINIAPDTGAFNSDLVTSRIKLTDFFDSIREYLDTCDAFFCERQLKKASFVKQIEHHCYSYFSMIYHNNRVISDVSASEKYQFLGCEHRLPKNVRKKWATRVCLNILDCRKDEKTLLDLMSKKKGKKKKLDDISDTVIICQALKVKIFIGR